MPVIVVRGADGEIHAFENRCAHRGALIALDDSGTAGKPLPVRLPRLELRPRGQPGRHRLREGHQRQGRHARRPSARRTTARASCAPPTLGGLVFATPVARHAAHRGISRRRGAGPRSGACCTRPVRVMGRFTQALPNNWKLYVENVKDTYHASLLHTFFGTFRITRLTQGGGVLVSPDGGHHASYTIDRADDARRAPPTASRASAPRTRTTGSPIRACSTRSTSSATASSCRSSPSSRASCCSRSTTASRCARCCPRGPARWSCTGPISASPTTRPRCSRRRLKQSNLVGPAGYVSMEDGCVGGFVQRGRRRGGGRAVGGQHGRRGRRVAGDARHRGLGARLLEGVSAVHGRTEDGWPRARLGSQLNAEYARAIDDDRLEELAGLLHRSLPLQDHLGRQLPARACPPASSTPTPAAC